MVLSFVCTVMYRVLSGSCVYTLSPGVVLSVTEEPTE